MSLSGPTLAGAVLLLATPAVAFDVQGHRGCGRLAPGNTLLAVRKAIALGVPTLEVDAQVTADRVLVALHDQELDPARCRRSNGMAPGARLVRDLASAEVTDTTCDGGEHVPRLADVLRLAREAPQPVRLNIEIKMQDEDRGVPAEEFAALLVDLVTREGVRDRTIIQSFSIPALRAVRRLAPDVATSVLCRDRRTFERRVADSGAGILSPRRDELRASDVDAFHAMGVAVIPWVVDDPDDMKRLIEWGVDGVITDRPDVALRVRDEARADEAKRPKGVTTMNASTAAAIALLAVPAAAGPSSPSDAVVEVSVGGGSPAVSGFLLDDAGHVATVARAIQGAAPPAVTLGDGDVYDARVAAVDLRRNLAILKVAGFGLPSLALADSSQLGGDEAVRVFLGRTSLSPARLAGLHAADGFKVLHVEIPGPGAQPGAPVLDASGTVVAMLTSTGAPATAIPSNYLAGLYRDLVAGPPAPPPVPEPAATPAPETAPATTAATAEPALSLHDVRKIVVLPFTSKGRVDTYWTSLFLEEWRRRRIPQEVVDPYELALDVKDGEPFHAQGMLEKLRADARAAGAQAILVGEGKEYSQGFRCEARLIEVNRGAVLWLDARAASGFLGIKTGPSAKKEIVREMLARYPGAGSTRSR